MDAVCGDNDPLTGCASRSVAPIMISAVAKEKSRTPVGHGSVKSLDIDGLTRNSSATNHQSVAKTVGFTFGGAAPPMPVMESKDASCAPDKGIDANYNRALNFLKSNPPEGRLDVQLPRTKYLQLEKAFLKLYPESLELRYPSLSYDSFTETVTVVTCPGNIHESAALGLLNPMVADAEQYLSTHSLASRILDYGSTTTKNFEGEFEGSTKQPDGGVRYKYLDGNKVTVVLEAGFSEDYNSLCRSKDMWINGHGVNVYILLCLTEKPRFKNPTTEYGDIEDVKAAITLMESSMNETLGLNLSNNRHVQFLYRGHKWAGELKDVFIEIWRTGTSISSRYTKLFHLMRLFTSKNLWGPCAPLQEIALRRSSKKAEEEEEEEEEKVVVEEEEEEEVEGQEEKEDHEQGDEEEQEEDN
ncbi:hypothetical protein V1517DRAFT_376163 [Lipomyces orientalis]|uniref:Uncharacterized protein n=1 Tax=Lipomyces orientalis TaxID=1233043 RepID=A0ACC3TFD8_9ASCO